MNANLDYLGSGDDGGGTHLGSGDDNGGHIWDHVRIIGDVSETQMRWLPDNTGIRFEPYGCWVEVVLSYDQSNQQDQDDISICRTCYKSDLFGTWLSIFGVETALGRLTSDLYCSKWWKSCAIVVSCLIEGFPASPPSELRISWHSNSGWIKAAFRFRTVSGG